VIASQVIGNRARRLAGAVLSFLRSCSKNGTFGRTKSLLMSCVILGDRATREVASSCGAVWFCRGRPRSSGSAVRAQFDLSRFSEITAGMPGEESLSRRSPVRSSPPLQPNRSQFSVSSREPASSSTDSQVSSGRLGQAERSNANKLLVRSNSRVNSSMVLRRSDTICRKATSCFRL
jgi:hypothetical protein